MDHLDEAIIEQLESDGRLSNLSIAENVGISRAIVAARLQRLVDSGQVEIRGVVHPAVLQRGRAAYLRIRVDGPVAPVAHTIAGHDEVTLVSFVTGPYGLVAEVRAASTEQIDAATARVRAVTQVRTVESLGYREVLRDVVGPIGEVDHTLDATDVALLRLLQDDGRTSYVDLAGQVKLSPAGARRRVLRLLQGNVLRVGVVVRQTGRDPGPLIGVGVRLSGHHESVVAALLERPAVIFLGRTFGHFDLLMTIRAHATDDLAELLDVVRAIPGVYDLESWTHLHVLKETYAASDVTVPASAART
jgi:DNA-binding Lrp family transcriptional regulator